MQIKYPAIVALLTQVFSAIVVFVLLRGQFSLEVAVIFQGIIAAIITKILKLNLWWIIINLLFVPTVFFINHFELPRWIFLVGFFILLLMNWNSFKDRVPLYLTGDQTIKKLIEILEKEKNGFKFIDLGSGLAGTLYELSKIFPNSEFYGVETAPLVFLISWIRCLMRRNCHIRYRSIWNVNLSEYDIVYCFLSPVPMPEIWEKAKKEMKKGALLISNTFGIPNVTPTKTIELKDWRDSKIIIWKI